MARIFGGTSWIKECGKAGQFAEMWGYNMELAADELYFLGKDGKLVVYP